MKFLILQGIFKVDESANTVKDKMHLELYVAGIRYRCAVALEEGDKISPGFSKACKLICVTENMQLLVESIEKVDSVDVTFGSSHVGKFFEFTLKIE